MEGVEVRVGQVIGTVTVNRSHPSLKGAVWKIVVPLSLDNLLARSAAQAEELVVYDETSSHEDCRVAFSEGREAAQPFDEPKPVDAYVAAILDHIDVRPLGDY